MLPRINLIYPIYNKLCILSQLLNILRIMWYEMVECLKLGFFSLSRVSRIQHWIIQEQHFTSKWKWILSYSLQENNNSCRNIDFLRFCFHYCSWASFTLCCIKGYSEKWTNREKVYQWGLHCLKKYRSKWKKNPLLCRLPTAWLFLLFEPYSQNIKHDIFLSKCLIFYKVQMMLFFLFFL